MQTTEKMGKFVLPGVCYPGNNENVANAGLHFLER